MCREALVARYAVSQNHAQGQPAIRDAAELLTRRWARMVRDRKLRNLEPTLAKVDCQFGLNIIAIRLERKALEQSAVDELVARFHITE